MGYLERHDGMGSPCDQGSAFPSSIVIPVLVAMLLVVVGCEDQEDRSEMVTRASLAAAGDISEAESVARAIVDEAVQEFLPDREARDAGLGRIPCSTGEPDQVEYDYAISLTVPEDEILDITDRIWSHWRDEYGFTVFNANSFSEPPDVLAEADGFRGSILGSADPETINVAVGTSCFPSD